MATPAHEPVLIAVIGGSGVYKMPCLTNPEEIIISTPFGATSDAITVATVSGVRCAFLPRHGRHHRFTPTEVPFKANIYALKTLGVKYLISICAVGSLREAMRPGDFVLPDQLIDRTTHRHSTFFGNGCVGHVTFGSPIDAKFQEIVLAAAAAAIPSVKVHPKGTLVTMEGPAFSTRAESLANRQIGGDLIGMTTATESKLAREAEMAHVVVSMVTDVDAWSDEPHVDVSQVMEVMKHNTEHVQALVPAVIEAVAKNPFESDAHQAVKVAIMTPAEYIPEQTRRDLAPIIGKYVKC